MDITTFTIKIILLCVPGIICYLISSSLSEERTNDSNLIAGIKILVFGFINYSIYSIAHLLYEFLYKFYYVIVFNIYKTPPNNKVYFLTTMLDPNANLNFVEIYVVTLISIFVGLIFTYWNNNKSLHWILRRFNIVKTYAEGTLWATLMNSPFVDSWVIVHDLKNSLAYYGYISNFKENLGEFELYITDVNVIMESTGKQLYSSEGIYLTGDKKDITIEVIKTSEGEQNDTK